MALEPGLFLPVSILQGIIVFFCHDHSLRLSIVGRRVSHSVKATESLMKTFFTFYLPATVLVSRDGDPTWRCVIVSLLSQR